MTNNTIIHKCSTCPKTYKNVASLKKHMDACGTKAVGAVNATTQPTNTSSNGLNDIISQMKAVIASTQSCTTDATLPSSQASHASSASPASQSSQSSQKINNKNYDINMTIGKGNKIQIDVKKQHETKNDDVRVSDDSGDDSSDDNDEDSNTNIDGSELKEILRPKVSPTYQDEIDKLENLIDLFKHMHVSNDPAKKDITITQLKNTLAVLMTQSQSLIKEMKVMAHRNCYYKNNIMLSAYLLDRCRHEVPDDEEEFEIMFNDRMRR